MAMLYEKNTKSASLSMCMHMLDRFMPSTCPSCHAETTKVHMFCPKCWLEIPFIGDPTCEGCGREIEGQIEKICLDCWNTPPIWQRGYATVNYHGAGRDLILSYKNSKAEWLAPSLAHLMYQRNPEAFADIDAILAMPIHWRRRLTRGFNQAALLAYYLSDFSQIQFKSHILERIRYTKKQGKHRNFDARFSNLENAIIVPTRYWKDVNKRRFLIIDDVMTSGASLHNCTKALLEAGAFEVRVLVFARAGIND